jgi:hypothetical protein
MTIICCWLDESYGRSRLTAIADARAAYKDEKDEWKPLTETTTKLFALEEGAQIARYVLLFI